MSEAPTETPDNVEYIDDRLSNLTTGIGVAGHDKSVGGTHSFTRMTSTARNIMHQNSWLARRVVDTPAHDMTRRWRQWEAPGEVAEKIVEVEQALGVSSVVTNAIIAARLHGEGAIYVGTGRNRLTPLVPESLPKGGIKTLRVYSDTQINADTTTIINDIDDPYDGEAEFFTISRTHNGNNVSVRVHRSRLIFFKGASVPGETAGLFTGQSGTHQSVLDSCKEAIDDATLALANVNALMADAKTDVLSIVGLDNQLSTPQGIAKVKTYAAEFNQVKSQLGVALLDSTSKWDRKNQNFAQLVDIATLFLQNVAAASEIPVTKLLGVPPTGLNATGEGDQKNYYDVISARQETGLRAALRPLDALLLRHAGVTGVAVGDYSWRPLFLQTPKEAAETSKAKAEAIAAIQSTALVPQPVLASMMETMVSADDTFPGARDAYEELNNKVKIEPLIEPEEDGDDPEP